MRLCLVPFIVLLFAVAFSNPLSAKENIKSDYIECGWGDDPQNFVEKYEKTNGSFNDAGSSVDSACSEDGYYCEAEFPNGKQCEWLGSGDGWEPYQLQVHIYRYQGTDPDEQKQKCENKADQGSIDTDVLVSDEPYLPAQVCDNKCTAFYSGGVTANEYSGTGDDKVYYFNNVTMSYSGDTCTVGEGGSEEPADEQGTDAPECGVGEQLGTVNGEWSCQPKGGDSGGNDGGSDGGDSGGGDSGGDTGGGDGSDGSDGTAPDGSTTSGTVTLSDGTVQEVEFNTEGLAQEETNQDIKEGVKDLVDEDGANDEPKDMFEQNMEDEWDKTKIEEQIEEAEEGDVQGLDAENEVDGFAGEVENAFPNVGCSGVNMELAQGYTWSISCADFTQVRNILSWVFYVFTALALFNLFAESGGGKR